MRKYTELTANIRGLLRSKRGWMDYADDSTVSGGGGDQRLPNALAVLAASEARLIFLLVKLSGCKTDGGYADEQSESEARAPVGP